MAYTPNDLTVYTAAYSGVISGFVASGRIILDGVPADYSGEAMISGAFAQAFDLAWEVNPDTIPPDTLQVMIIEKACKGVWENRNTEVSSNSLLPESYTELCNGIIALVIASESFVNGQGITPDPWPGGGTGTVDSVNAGTGIAVTGPATDPIVSNTGVLGVTAGTNITVTGTASNPIINNNGVRSVTAGTNVTIGGTANNPVINASASGGSGTVTSVSAGTGISITGSPTTTPTVNNTGVTSNVAGTGIGVSSATGASTISNTGVTSIVAGTGISVNAATGAVTVTATGVAAPVPVQAVGPNLGVSLADGASHQIIPGAGSLAFTIGASGNAKASIFVPYVYDNGSNTTISFQLLIDGSPSEGAMWSQELINAGVQPGLLPDTFSWTGLLQSLAPGAHTATVTAILSAPAATTQTLGPPAPRLVIEPV